MPRLATTDKKDCYTRQVVKVHQSATDGKILSYHMAHLYALDGSRIGFCDMINSEDELQYPE